MTPKALLPAPTPAKFALGAIQHIGTRKDLAIPSQEPQNKRTDVVFASILPELKKSCSDQTDKFPIQSS